MVTYAPPPENLDGLNPIQRFMQRKSTMEDYFYLTLFVLCYIAARPSIKKGAEWLLATPEYKEGKRKQQEYEQQAARAKIGANAIRGQKETPAQLLDGEGGTSAVETAATTGQVQNRKTKGSGANKSEVDKLLDWDDEPARPKQKGDGTDVVAWLDNTAASRYSALGLSKLANSTPRVQQHVDLSANLGRHDPSPADEAAYKSGLERSEEARDYNKMRPRIIYDNLPARKIHAYDPADNAARRPAGQLLQRSRPAPGAQGPPGQLLQRGKGVFNRGPRRRSVPGRGNVQGDAAALGPGRRLRITDAEEDDGVPDLSQRRRGGRRSASTPGAPAADENGDHDPDEDLDDPALDFEEEPSLADQAAFEREVSRLPSDNPTTAQPYNPVPPSLSDLENYWPNTPLSATGLRASVSQHLAPLANRQTTSFWTPLQLAQQFVSGQFVSLHSEREKQAMMEFVPRLLAEKTEAVEKYAQARSERDAANFNADAFHAKRKAARLPDTNRNDLPEFVSLTDRRLAPDATQVVAQMVRGRYEHPNAALDQAKWGKMKWMGDVERNLTVNETYGPADRSKFLGRLADMVKEMQQQGAKTRAKKQQQQQAA
ncbi:hypothetical protein DV735_g3554, partial [Chaetothyriales sp. CBS 134920]